MANNRTPTIAIGIILIVGIVVGGYLWQQFQQPGLPESFASGNGQIEATEVDIATKLPGRLVEVLAREGDLVGPGQILARMDSEQQEAYLREAEAQLRQTRESKNRALAIVTQRESELAFAEKEYQRSQVLVKDALISREKVDQDRSTKQTAEAALQAAQVGVREAEAAIEAAVAGTERIKTDIGDGTLKAPAGGRVLYRLAEPGEVLAGGGKVLTVLELTEVYMSIFLPAGQAGRVTVGDEARIVLDVRPDLVIPAKISFVAPRAQFTPKEVETRTEREKLMFRIKVQIDPALLKRYVEKVKTGVRGVAYVRLDPDAEWPENLQVRLPQ